MKRLVSLLLCLFLVFCFPRPAQAAIGVSQGAPMLVSTSNADTYDFSSTTLTGDAVIVVIAFIKGTATTLAMVNVSGDALTWTAKSTGAWPTGDPTHQYGVFWAKTPASPVASVYQVTCTGDVGTAAAALMFQFTGADLVTADPVKQVAVNSDSTGATSANGTFGTNLGTNNGYAAAWCGNLGANSSTPPASWTETADAAVTAPTTNGSGAFRAGGETGTNIAFTHAVAIWGFAAVEVYVSGAGPGGGTPSPRKRVIILEIADRRRHAALDYN